HSGNLDLEQFPSMNDFQPINVSVVVPVYGSATTLRPLTDRLVAVLQALALTYELVFVDDGSRDQSWQVLQELHAAGSCYTTVIRLMRNYGQHNALMCGFRHCRGSYIVTMDDDLQNPPEELPKLLKEIQTRELDLVYGRCDAKKHSPWRNLGSAIVNTFYRVVFKSSVTVTSFRVMRRELMESILPYCLHFTYVDGLFAWNTQRIGQVMVEHHPRPIGRSGYSLGKLVTSALNLFTNFSLLPLQAVSALGFLAAAGGFLLGTYYLVLYLFSRIAIAGYASIIVAVLMLGG